MKKIFLAVALIFLLSEVLSAEPNYSFYLERRDEQGRDYMHSRRWAKIARNGGLWELAFPLADFEVKNFAEPDFEEKVLDLDVQAKGHFFVLPVALIALRIYRNNLKYSFCKGSCFIKNYCPNIRQYFEIV